MKNDKKLGRAVNIFCCILCIFMFMVRSFYSEDFGPVGIFTINMVLIFFAAALIVADIVRDSYPVLIRTIIGGIYISLCVLSIFINGGNNNFFMLVMLSIGLVSLLFERVMLIHYICVSVTVSVVLYLLPAMEQYNVYKPIDYWTNILCLFVETIIIYNVQRILFERDEEINEEHKTVDELLRVIEAKREDALAATRSKSDFLASMSHEIRTPINAVIGLNEMILRESDEKSTVEYAQDIRSASNTLLSLVNDILDFSKIEAGKMEIHPVVYDLGGMLNDLINIIGMRATEKGLSLQLDIDHSLPHVLFGDEVRIKQVITNILSNAMKYTQEGSIELIVMYKKIDEYQIDMTIRVSDTGQGMKKEDMEKLFAPFERIEEIKNRHVEGTGLGMTLTRNFLHLMGSELEVESEYGEGSTFSFTIRQEVENWECIGSLDEALNRVKSAALVQEEYFWAPEAKVLVVDDMPMNLKVFSSLLKRTGIQIDTALSGVEALGKVREVKYDLIFLDHMMPEMDGMETLEKMNTDRFNINRYETPIIVLTANAVSGAREMYIAAGFTDYITKPIDSSMLEMLCVKYLPDEKVSLVSETELHEMIAKSENVPTDSKDIPGVDRAAGIEASGDEEIYEEVMKEYAITIDTYADLIQKHYNEKDYRNYTIQVHALKSSSRLLGALELSELAASLEKAGNDGNISYIDEKTDILLSMYRGLKEPLNKALGIDAEGSDDRELIDTSLLKDALMAIGEGISCFDFDLIESVMSQLEEYRMPDSFADKYEQMKVCIARVATEELEQIIKTELEEL